jgi:DNA-binding MarR family transcriptional regulator/GNAT superfamily N-acetyltransferase
MTILTQQIDSVRRFNRFYTKHIGALNEGLLNSRFSLTEMRLLYELNAESGQSAAILSKKLGMDPAYLSRILKDFRSKGLIETYPNAADGRQRDISLTEFGRETFAPFIQASRDEVAAVFTPLTLSERKQLLNAMDTITDLLSDERTKRPFVIRPHRAGDIGWVIHRHARLYSDEFGFDTSFEGLVATIAGEFLESHDPKCEQFWVAERDGNILGSICLVRKDKITAKLRLLYVEPSARGEGVGSKLIDECLSFARHAGYTQMTLWTQDILKPAIRLYEKAGFTLSSEEKHHSFGQDLIAQNWDLDL